MTASNSRGKTFQQAVNGCQIDHALSKGGEEFIVFGQPTIGTPPSNRALHDPAPGDDGNACEGMAASGNIDAERKGFCFLKNGLKCHNTWLRTYISAARVVCSDSLFHYQHNLTLFYHLRRGLQPHRKIDAAMRRKVCCLPRIASENARIFSGDGIPANPASSIR